MSEPLKVQVVEPPPKPLTRGDIEAMGPQEMEDRWDEVQKFLAHYEKAKPKRAGS